MSLRTVIQILCDMPHDREVDDAITVAITTPDGTWEVDLCAAHAERFLLPVISVGRRAPKTRAARGSRSQATA